MQIKYRISLEDWREAQKLMRKSISSRRSKFADTAGIILLLMGIFIVGLCIAEVGNTWIKVGIVAALLILPRFGRIYCSRVIDQRYNENPWIQRDLVADLHDDRFEVDDGAGAKRSETWDHYDRFREGKNVFIIGGPSMIFTIISKAQMSENEQSFIRELLPRVISQN